METMQPPYSAESEIGFLSALFATHDAIQGHADRIAPDDFYLAKHGLIYRAMLDCMHEEIRVDIRVIAEKLRRSGKLESIGGIAYLGELISAPAHGYNLAQYASDLKAASVRRGIIAAGGKIAAMGYDESAPLEVTIGNAQVALNAATGAGIRPSFIQVGDAALELAAALNSPIPPGTPSGYTDLDNLMGGLHRDTLTILAARPGVGKTSFAMCIADNVAESQRGPVAVFSLEMSRQQLIMRLVAARSGIPLERMRDFRVTPEEMPLILAVAQQLKESSMYIDESPAPTVNTIRAQCHRLTAEHGPLALVIIDYLQLMAATGRYSGNRVQEVGEISRGLKQLSRELHAPVLALSQLSRAVESRSSKVPMLSDLRDSGALEQDADNVIFLHREELYDPETSKKGIAELHIAKHRAGQTAIIPLRFDGATTSFQSLSYRTPEGF